MLRSGTEIPTRDELLRQMTPNEIYNELVTRPPAGQQRVNCC